MLTVIINQKAANRIRQGYLWVYRDDVVNLQIGGEAGQLVKLTDEVEQCVGYGYLNWDSIIVCRKLYSPAIGQRYHEEVDEAVELSRKMDRALSRRAIFKLESNAYRLIWSEADGLPGLICDVYGDWVVVQFLTIGIEKRRKWILTWLQTKLKPQGIYERREGKFEGLESKHEWLLAPENKKTEILIKEGSLSYLVDISTGHKTGFYLDQRAGRRQLIKQKLTGTVLDCFCNTGGFSIAAAAAGANKVIALDCSAVALQQVEKNAKLNHYEQIIEAKKGDVFDFLTEATERKEQYQAIILDPPSFAKSRKDIANAVRGYRELHRKAARLLAPNGYLLTFTCSHHITAATFKQAVVSGVKSTGRSLQLKSFFGPDSDHPVRPQLPESRYLQAIEAIIK